MGQAVAPVLLQSVPVVVRHFALTAGLPALVLLATVAALVSVADALAAASVRAVAGVAAVGGLLAVAVGVVALLGGGEWAVPALAAGTSLLGSAAVVVVSPGSLGFGRVLAVAAVVTVVLGFALDARVDAFGWRRPVPVPVQSVALVGAAAAFAPLGYAVRLRRRTRWLLAAVVVATPFAVVAPAVPVGGLGPFFVAVLLSPWAVVVALVGTPLFALGWVGADRSTTPSSPEVGR